MRISFFAFLFFAVSISFGQQPEQAYEKFNEAYFKGLQAWIKRHPEKAVKYFEKCISIKDSVPAVYYYLADAYQEMKQTEAARAYIETAVRLRPGNKWFKKLENEIKNAPVVQFDVKKNDSGTDIPVARTEDELLRDLAKHRNTMDAQQYFRKISRLAQRYPFYAKLQYEAARTAFDLRKYDEAENYLINGMDFALARKDLLKKYYRLLVEIYRITGKEKEAKKYSELLKKL